MSISTSSLQLHLPPEFQNLDWLWYEESAHKTAWTFSASGGLPDLLRMLNGLPSYREQQGILEKAKRKLILNDWTAEKWSPEKIEETKARFLALVEAGFEIYAWQNDDDKPLIKLTKKKLEDDILADQAFRDKITPVSIEKLKAAASLPQYNIAVEALEFLNCVHVKELLGHDGWMQDKKYYVTLTDVVNSQFSNAILIQRIIEEHNGEIFSDIAETPNENEMIAFWRRGQGNVKLVDKLPITLTVDHKNIRNIADFYGSEQKEILDNLHTLTFNGVHDPEQLGTIYTHDNFVNIKSLGVFNSSINIMSMLSKLSFLKSLAMRGCVSEEMDIPLKNMWVFKDLQFLNLTSCGFNPSDVKNILMSGTQLESFIYRPLLENQKLELDAEEIEKSGAFSNLRSLEVVGDIDPHDLLMILKYATKLQHLTLKKCLKPTTIDLAGNVLKPITIDMTGCALEHLKSLTVEEISSEAFHSLAENTREISYLNVKGIFIDRERFHKIPVENLKTLIMEKSFIEPAVWLSFFERALKLETLISDSAIKNASHLPEEALKHLKELEISHWIISAWIPIVHNILMHAKGLKRLSMLGYETGEALPLLEKLRTTNVIRAPDLKELKIEKSITKGNLQAILSHDYKKITRLDIIGCAGIQSLPPGFFSKEFLNRLERIIVNPNQLTIELAKEILAHAPNLDKESIQSLKACIPAQNVSIHMPRSSIATEDIEYLSSNVPSNTYDVDLDTKFNPEKQFNVTKIFWGINTQDPHPAHYRINVYDSVRLDPMGFINKGESDEAALELKELRHHPYVVDEDTFKFGSNVLLKQGEQCFYAKTEIILSDQWYPLPALSPQEILTHIHMPGVSKEDFEIQYSERDKLHYIRSKRGDSRKMMVDFLLKAPWPIERKGLHCSSEGIRTLAAKYRKNVEEVPGATDDPGNKTALEILDSLKSQQLVGACRHRVLAFKTEADEWIKEGKLPGISKVSAIVNDVHAYIEVEEEHKEEKEIACIDLGGHPARINISDVNAPSGAAPTPQSSVLPANTTALSGLEETIDAKRKRLAENSQFNTWKEKVPLSPSVEAYMHHLLQGKSTTEPNEQSVHKSLVQLDSKEAVEDFRLYLQKLGSSYHDREIYYIDSPEDLVCSANWIKKEGDKGTPMPGPGGPLHAFLTRDDFNPQKGGKKTPILLVNWNNFRPEQVIQFNNLYDNKGRRADGTPLPEHTRIIGLYNKGNPKSYKGSDFFSRWEDKSICPEEFKERLKTLVDKTHLRQFWSSKPANEALETKEEKERQEIILIDLYESDAWEELLLGRWSIQGGELVFKAGSLEKALQEAKTSGKTLELKNGPWWDEKFKVFLQQLRLKGTLDTPLGLIPIQSSAGYTWDPWFIPDASGIPPVRLERAESAPQEAHVLNPSNFAQYLHTHQYQATKEGELYEKPGWLEHHKKENGTEKPMSISLTRALSKHQWGQLLDAAKEQGLKLHITVAKEVSLPVELESFVETAKEVETFPSPVSTVYISEDIDFTVDNLKKQYPNAEPPIDVSEYEAHHLLEDLTPLVKGVKYAFKYKEQALLKDLMAGKTVILKGQFKPELVDALASLCVPNAHLWVNGKKCTVPGKLILVTDNAKHFGFTPVLHEDNKAIAQAKESLKAAIQKELKESEESRELKAWLDKQSYVQLKASLRHMETGGRNPQANWKGFKEIVPTFELEPPDLSPEAYKKASQDFKQARYEQIHNVLKHNPFVFIAGMTGVGKSTFIRKELEKIPGSPYKVYFETKALSEWAKPPENPQDLKVLFIDEANIDAGDFSVFEGLLDTPPHILVDGQDLKLTENHKVIFAGNPLSYGSRKLPALFERHGGAIIFPPMSSAYIYEKVIEPILRDLPEALQFTMGQKILEVYQKILPLSKDTVLISPRELEMMALLIMAKHHENPDAFLSNTDFICNRVIGKIIKPLIPSKNQSSFAKWLDAAKPLVGDAIVLPKTNTTDSFLVTSSRLNAYEQIQDLLALRKLRQESSNEAIKKAPGLGGLILEGEPGVGKSEFIVNCLVHAGFNEMHFKPESKDFVSEEIHAKESTVKDGFYRMPVSMQNGDKEAVNTKALHDGHWVIVDEMNACPMVEKSLNAFMMGQDLEGHDANNPGSICVSTQNPISYESRKATSLAIERRSMKENFKHYAPPELEAIVQHKGLSLEEARSLVEDYWTTREYAKEFKKEPGPTFRDLSKAVDAKLEARKAELKLATESREKLREIKVESEEESRPRTYLPLREGKVESEGEMPPVPPPASPKSRPE